MCLPFLVMFDDSTVLYIEHQIIVQLKQRSCWIFFGFWSMRENSNFDVFGFLDQIQRRFGAELAPKTTEFEYSLMSLKDWYGKSNIAFFKAGLREQESAFWDSISYIYLTGTS